MDGDGRLRQQRDEDAKVLIVQDQNPPLLTAPADLTISCVQDQQDNTAAIIDWLDNYTVSDGCDSEPTVTHNFSATTINYCTGDDITVTWTATDDCGNSMTKAAKIEITKGSAPAADGSCRPDAALRTGSAGQPGRDYGLVR
ncbi:MAG: hypothetical protein IPJ82_05645 [Lewinellaceae bacterium]|nr:hypothetical protein [Lewinellaceae bacterium]